MEALVIRKIIGGEIRGYTVRPEIAEFAISMEATMVDHDPEHPNGKNDSVDMLYEHLLEEVEEVNLAFQDLRSGSNPTIKWNQLSQECIDVANMCMMLARRAQEMNSIQNPSVIKS